MKPERVRLRLEEVGVGGLRGPAEKLVRLHRREVLEDCVRGAKKDFWVRRIRNALQ